MHCIRAMPRGKSAGDARSRLASMWVATNDSGPRRHVRSRPRGATLEVLVGREDNEDVQAEKRHASSLRGGKQRRSG